MLVLALIVAAIALFGHGYATESTSEVAAAGSLALVAVVVIGVDRYRARPDTVLEESDDTVAEEVGHDRLETPEPDGQPDPDPDTDPELEVVFVPGRTTFHLATCMSVADKPTSSARRDQLERGGMTACHRCLP